MTEKVHSFHQIIWEKKHFWWKFSHFSSPLTVAFQLQIRYTIARTSIWVTSIGHQSNISKAFASSTTLCQQVAEQNNPLYCPSIVIVRIDARPQSLATEWMKNALIILDSFAAKAASCLRQFSFFSPLPLLPQILRTICNGNSDGIRSAWPNAWEEAVV